MAEEAVVVGMEQQPVEDLPVSAADEQPAAEQADAEAPVQAEDAAAAAAEGGSKRSREEDADGEELPEAKKHAGLEGQLNEADGAVAAAAGDAEQPAQSDAVVAAPDAAAAAEPAVANGSDNPGHAGVPEGEAQAAHAVAGNPGQAAHPEHTGPPPVKEGLGTTANDDGTMSELIAVSKHLVGKLIGKAGATIQSLQQDTATNIQIDQNESPDHPDSKIVTLRGPAENVAQAKAAIKKLLEEAAAPQEGEVEEKISCPAGIVGRIIGRGGETIRSLQQSSSSHIMVDQNFPEGADRMVIIKGQRENVTRAAAMINELIAGEPGSASAIIAKHSVGVNLTVSCPKTMVGRVIGKGGDTIKGLQRKYHTSIQVEQQGDPMTITITGPKGSAEMCKQEITALINDPYPPGPGGPRGMGGYPRGPPGYGPPGGYGGPGPYGGPPPPAYGAPYGAPYGSPYPPYGAPYPSPGGGYGGYGAPAPAPYSGGGGAYGGAGYGQSGYGGAAGGSYGQGGYGGQAGGYGGAAGGSGYGGDGASGGAAGAAAGGYGGGAAAAAPAASSVWQAMNDEQGRTYYYNSQTGVSQWEKPAEMP